jgi:hypothetical protein
MVRVPLSASPGQSPDELLARVEVLLFEAVLDDPLSECDSPGDVQPDDGQVVAWLMVPDPEAGTRLAAEVLTRAGLAAGASVWLLLNGERGEEVRTWPDPDGVVVQV